MKKNEPFPTTFWLICPYLKKKIGALEAQGAVSELERCMRADPILLFRYHMLHARIRLMLMGDALRRYMDARRPKQYRSLRRGGVGGIAYEYGAVFAKCLHLHTASYLALGYHPAGEMIDRILGDTVCADGICRA